MTAIIRDLGKALRITRGHYFSPEQLDGVGIKRWWPASAAWCRTKPEPDDVLPPVANES